MTPNCSRADLRHADLTRANLNGANLSGSQLSYAKFTWASLIDTRLDEANLSEASLGATSLIRTNLKNANLSMTNCDLTVFTNVDLSEAKGLNSIRHRGPSTIGLSTLFRSKGQIPEAFLRGCGVPEDVIIRLPALIHSVGTIQFYSCFISFSHKDEDFAKRLHDRMVQEKLRVWYSPEDMPWGQKLYEVIDHAIRLYDKLLVVLSPNSMNSEWVKTEIRKARKAELKDNRRKLFPIRLVDFDTIRGWECFDADDGKDLAVEIREYLIPDFSNWKDDGSFEAAFARLVESLKMEKSAGAVAIPGPLPPTETLQ